MSRYYFHLCDGNGMVEDEEGRELADDESARLAAIKDARCVMRGELRDGTLNLASFIEVEDDRHAHLFTLTFREAVKVEG